MRGEEQLADLPLTDRQGDRQAGRQEERQTGKQLGRFVSSAHKYTGILKPAMSVWKEQTGESSVPLNIGFMGHFYWENWSKSQAGTVDTIWRAFQMLSEDLCILFRSLSENTW